MLSTAIFRNTPYKSFPICFCLAASIPCSHPDVWKSFPSRLSAQDANFLHPLLASHTRKSLSHRQLQYRNTSPDAPRSACPLPALLETHLPGALHKAAASEDGAAGGVGHPTARPPFGTGSNEVLLMADTLTEHQTCSTGTLSTWKHPHLVHNYGLARHSPLFSPSSSCSSLSVPILVLPLHGIF